MKLAFLSLRQSLRHSTFLVICLVTAVMSAAAISALPIYIDAVETLGLRRMTDSLPPSGTGAWVQAREVAFNPAAVRATIEVLDEAEAELGPLSGGKTVFVRSGLLTARQVDTDGPTLPGGWRFQSIIGRQPELRVVNGRRPNGDGAVEVLIAAASAETLGITVGDRFRLTVPPTDIAHSEATVVGTFAPTNPNSAQWQGLYRTLMNPESGATGGAPPIIALVSHAELSRLASDSIADLGEIWAVYTTDSEALTQLSPGRAHGVFEQFRSFVSKHLAPSASASGIQSALGALQRQLAFASATTRVTGSLFVAFLIFVLFALARMVYQLRDMDRSGLEARGATRFQVAQTFLIHGAVLLCVPTVLGPMVSGAIVPQIGRTSGFAGITNGAPLAWSLTLEQFALAAAVSALVAVYYFVPAVLTRIGPMLTSAARNITASRLWIWRANLDVVVAVAALALIYEANSRGALLSADGSVQLASAILPVAAAVVAALAGLRAMRIIGFLFAMVRGIRRLPGLATTSILFSRSIMGHTVPMLVGAGVMVVAITSTGLQATVTANYRDRASFAAAADVRLTNIDGYRAERNSDVERLRQLDWVGDSAWSIRTTGRAGPTEQSPNFDFLAVQPDRFAEIAWFRPDFADQSLAELMVSISGQIKPTRLAVPDDSTLLVLEAEIAFEGSGRIDLWSRVKDATGRTHTLQMERAESDEGSGGRPRYASSIDAALPRPLALLAIEVYEPPVSPLGNPVELRLHSLRARSANGDEMVVSDFDDSDVWHPILSSVADNVRIAAPNVSSSMSNSEGESAMSLDNGTRRSNDGMRVAMGRGTDDGIRGIYYAPEGPVVVPVIVNNRFIDETGLSVGDTFTGSALGRFVPFEIRGSYNLFPSLTDPNHPSAVSNSDALLDYISPVSEPFLGNSAELIADTRGLSSAERRRAEVKSINPSIGVIDRTERTRRSAGELASVAGWEYVGMVATSIAAVLGLLALFAFGLRFSHDERRNSALMESIGATRLTTTLGLVFRLSVPVAFGIMVGGASGIFGTYWFAQNMTRTEDGSIAVPPLQLAVEWPLILIVAATALISAVAPAFINARYGHRSIATRIRSATTV